MFYPFYNIIDQISDKNNDPKNKKHNQYQSQWDWRRLVFSYFQCILPDNIIENSLLRHNDANKHKCKNKLTP